MKRHDNNIIFFTALTSEEMTAQAILFFVGGFETVSSALNFCLYELTLNPDVQVKMREEIDEALRKYGRKLNYDALQDMTYMDAVIYGKHNFFKSRLVNTTCGCPKVVIIIFISRQIFVDDTCCTKIHIIPLRNRP